MIRASYKWPSKSPGDGRQPTRLSRRALILAGLSGVLEAQKADISSFDLSLIDDPAVPNEFFFTRDHFPQPNVSSAGWKIAVGGAVATPLDMGLDSLGSWPRVVLPVTIECAENPAGGGLVSHAEWSGVTLASVIEKARPREEARFVRLTGADGYTREIPLIKAMHADTMLAVQMNGEKLPPAHGSPIRAIIPGWYGMDSVKWLRRIELREQEDTSVPSEFRYRRRIKSLLAGTRESDPVTAINVKSEFSRPVDGAILTGRQFIVRGVAWAGENRVRSVEVSVDSGKTWEAAKLPPQSQPYTWVQWEYGWKIPKGGEYELLARAADASGRVQPVDRAPDRADAYELNECQRVHVQVL